MLAAAFAGHAARGQPQQSSANPSEAVQDAERARAAELAARRQAAARADAAAAEERRLAAERVASAAKLRGAEQATADAASEIEALSRRRAEAELRLRARADELGPLLPLIERLSLFPAETMLAVPAPPEDALRGILAMKAISRELETDAAALKREQAEIDTLAAAIEARRPKLAAAEAAQAAQEAALDRQIGAAHASRTAAEDEAAAAASRAEAEAARAETLRGVIARIEAQRRQDEVRARDDLARAERQRREADAAQARERQQAHARPSGPGTIQAAAHAGGQLTAPVAGNVIRAWGEAGEGGPASGISYRAAPGARVVSPCGGRVVFAAPFRSYGKLLILDCGGGYHVVLAGLNRLDVQVGVPVEPGEPVGLMPGWDPAAQAPPPALYVELRRDGQPVNPAPWLRGRG